MAAARGKMAVGSSGWLEGERQHVAQSVEQEAEEFSYSVRNELEWLQEHMGDIFNNTNVNFADVFKTPGKLRGKTPRTARKQLVAGPRQPLTDIFAPNAPVPQSAQKTPFFDKIARFQIAEDAENQVPAHRPNSRSKSPQRVGKNVNTDSGYHGMTEDEMEVDSNKTETATESSQQSYVQTVPLREDQPPPQRLHDGSAGAVTSSDDSFMSAKEDVTSRNASKLQLRETAGGDDMDDDNSGHAVVEMDTEEQVPEADEARPTTAGEAIDAAGHDQGLDFLEDSQAHSDASSPGIPLQRKSSFTFTALPARNSVTAAKSIAARNSQVDIRNSTLGRSIGTKPTEDVDDNEAGDLDEYQSEESKAHNKTSTQLLHEKINLLGKTKDARSSQNLHTTFLGGQTAYPQLPVADPSKTTPLGDDSDDDWIAPSKQSLTKEASPARPAMHQKSISTTQIPSPARPDMASDSRHLKAISISNPNFTSAMAEFPSTTPAGSPVGKKNHDGPLSASKNKLYSVLKSAKSIFASSASASAAAKLEAHNNSPSRTPRRDISDESKTAAVFNMPGALYSQTQLPPQSPSRTKSVISLVSTSPSRKTRSSNENDKKREKEVKAQQKAADGLEKAREKERQKVAKQQEEKRKAEEAEATKRERNAQKQLPDPPITAQSDPDVDPDMPPPPPPKSMLQSGKLRAPGRIVKPSREQAQPARPAPVSIRVASQSQRLHHAPASSLSKSQHDSSAPAAASRQPANRPGSSQSSVRGSAAPTNARVKALEAAARKKEADEKAAQEKAEKKRELEQRRAAKAEEDRRIEEERKAAEQQRLQEAKMVAKRQADQRAAAEAKRREEQRLEQQRAEQQRQQEEAQRQQAAHDLAESIKRERAQQQANQPRNDIGGTLRQLGKNIVPEPPVARPPIQTNPAKPAKRVWVPEDDDPSHSQTHQPQRPGLQRGPASFQQNDAKRRRTNEEDKPEERPSVMAPPKRPSNMRKESTLNKFPHGYTHAPPAANNHHPSMFKATVTAQHQLHHAPKSGMPVHPSQLAQVSNARIPFAENMNPPGMAPHHAQAKPHPGHENVQPGTAGQQNKFKTPGRPATAPKSAKSSPLYHNGDNIELPDIETDSEEEEDSEDENTGFRAPSWVASPALRDLLTQQQLVDPETVFGPIGELRMEEVFKGGKNPDRIKKFRDRSSSAMWQQNGDAVTSAEKRKDMAARERVAREGGWRYEPGNWSAKKGAGS